MVLYSGLSTLSWGRFFICWRFLLEFWLLDWFRLWLMFEWFTFLLGLWILTIMIWLRLPYQKVTLRYWFFHLLLPLCIHSFISFLSKKLIKIPEKSDLDSVYICVKLLWKITVLLEKKLQLRFECLQELLIDMLKAESSLIRRLRIRCCLLEMKLRLCKRSFQLFALR